MPEKGYDSCSIEQILAEHGEIMTSSAGISMYPMLRNRRDMVVIVKLYRKLKRHDVPLYRLKSGKLVLHRILKVKENGYVIRGDNLYEKEFVTDDMIVGVLKGFHREGKYYDCETSRAYHTYIIYNRLNYPLRWFWKKRLRPFLSKIKHKIIK
ncbi:MAG: hypothetical protein E7562_01025 [Ruminococcaceae bacterium]|nr:hypothetical protein [Oscillospiraceae bacterium]